MSENQELLKNTVALNCALMTIKERCSHLQKRLLTLESENSRLKLNESKNERNSISPDSEMEELRTKNAELSLQKNQLTENLSMISAENRKLWKRLSQMTKESENDSLTEPEPSTAKQNLIRSKTFTQNSPHQLLKEKLAGHQVGPDPDELENVSLINCGINYEIDGSADSEAVDVDSKACTEGLFTIKKELLKQNSDLKVALSNWRKLKNSESCPSCKSASNARPQMVDKNLETDRELMLEFEIEQEVPHNYEIGKTEHTLIDLIEQKRAADKAEKICPMCGKFYSQNVLFEDFQDHVESHFRDDSDIEHSSIEHTFELVSHSVGNF